MADKRVFIAIDLSEEARQAVVQHIDYLRSGTSDVRVGWERAEKLHVTLKFLGSVSKARISDLSDKISGLTSTVRPFRTALVGTGVFPNIRQPRVLWLGLRDVDTAMAPLAESVELACQQLGFPSEERKFKPHLTIARVREPRKGGSLAAVHVNKEFAAVEFQVREVVIYESELSPGGSVYTPLSRHPFCIT